MNSAHELDDLRAAMHIFVDQKHADHADSELLQEIHNVINVLPRDKLVPTLTGWINP